MIHLTSESPTAKRLAELYHRNGYVRRVDAVRKKQRGKLYKKGAELRLVAESAKELAEIRRLLRQAGFSLAKPFIKGKQWRQPLYGVKEVPRFLTLVGGVPNEGPRLPPSSSD